MSEIHTRGASYEDIDTISDAVTFWKFLDTGKRTNLFELKSIYGFSKYRDIGFVDGSEVDLPNSGRIEHTGSDFKLSTGSDGSHSTVFESAEFGRYAPGLIAEPGIAYRQATGPGSDQEQKWGYGNDNNSLMFGEDNDGLFIEIESGGSSVSKIRQSDWNIDKLDGSRDSRNPSGKTLDASDGHVYRIPFSWYGFGPALFQVLMQQGNETELVNVHMFSRDGNVLIDNPNLYTRVEINNNGTANAQECRVLGRQFSLLGDYKPNERVTQETNRSVSVGSSSFTNICTVRRKGNVTDGAFFESTSVKLHSISVISDSDAEFILLFDGDLTSASFGSFSRVDDSETALELDTSASVDVSTGNSLWEDIVAGGQGSDTASARTRVLDFDMVRRKPVSVLAKGVGSSASVSVTCRFREEW